MLTRTFLIVFCFILIPVSVFALSLEEGKRQGLIGERRNGYLDVVTSAAPSEIHALVEDVNAKRRAAYAQIAHKNGSPLSAVEQVGAKEAFDKSPTGTMIEGADGKWQPKN